MPDKDNNFSGSLILDFRKWWHYDEIEKKPLRNRKGKINKMYRIFKI